MTQTIAGSAEPTTGDRKKIWAHSGDSHAMEPEDLWTSRLPKDLADRAPRSERGEKYEITYVDGKRLDRQLNDFMDAMRPPGFKDLDIRLRDLEQEGVRCQLAFPSSGFWSANIEDPELSKAVAHAWNEWARDDFMARQNRIFTPAIVPLVDVADTVAEVEWAAENGFQAIFLPCGMPAEREWGLELWNPVWDAADAAGMVLAYHIGTGGANVVYRGPGGAVVNYMETTYPGMRVVSQLVAGGALDRRPNLKVLVAEGGAGWVPAIGDRMDEAYRQHGMFVRPRLDRLPSEIVRSQVYTSFQHDISAVQVIEGTGYYNVMWGDDYPHLEGTYGHTQDTLHEIFDTVDPRIKDRVLRGTFEELFDVPAPEELSLKTS
ncbi:amidohydrolase [Mycobacterium sp. CBMA293]|nr:MULTISPECIES: amidohydrolase family protein [unclassified Mycolicibacterium]MUL57215.1 amidohydrolase [Mycolicibacterium sp. CBMA 335]MUL70255.1 amidohydrolase [Mycolicibacterium sp. CBMA 311]MUL92303.1 amidohydrolase [Mycolicibacterium sp. CBMA 230]MUM06724.1 amidohydrolase [Mycolicibacterium sp. CBMA 213]MUM12614.1 amidohydrolase [Mycolicibacterium sp. CBMA 293]